jgi:hypothetical protein
MWVAVLYWMVTITLALPSFQYDSKVRYGGRGRGPERGQYELLLLLYTADSWLLPTPGFEFEPGLVPPLRGGPVLLPGEPPLMLVA